MTDWTAWHRSYDDPSSSLARRLVVVQRRLVEAILALGPGLQQVVSLCAGDGRDIIPILAEARLHPPPATLLVELDAALASVARDRAAAARLGSVQVVEGDAADTSLYADRAPIDLLLLCGIFGNISEDDIRTTITAAATLLRPGGQVIWTRGASEQDLRPIIRAWFEELGFEELSFDGDPEPFGVGVARRRTDAIAVPLPLRLFTFLR